MNHALKKNGRGLQILVNQKLLYKGEFKDDLRHGKGRLINENGTSISSTFLLDHIHGYADVIHLDNKIITKRRYEHGNIVEKLLPGEDWDDQH
jgi:hypothetical protein